MGDIELQIFADRLKELRSKMNITQKEFAEKIGVTAAALSAYENNVKNPSIAVAKRIAEVTNVSIDWLCGLTDKECYTEKIEKYSDILSLIIKLCSIDTPDGGFHAVYNEDFSNPVLNYAELQTTNKEIRLFLKDFSQIRTLLEQGTIDIRLYNLWVDDKLKEYDKKITTWEDAI